MRRGRERQISDAIGRLVEQIGPQDPLTQVTTAWPDLVGSGMAGHTKPSAVRGGTLTVDCDSSVYAQELELLSRKVVKAVNDRFGPGFVTAVRCSVKKF